MSNSRTDAGRAGQYLGWEINDRQVSELIGLARGLIADNELNDFEIEFLHKWLAANDVVRANPLISLLLNRIRDMYADGYIDEDERGSLVDVLKELTASDFELGETLRATTLPLDNPAPNISFNSKRFCFTGTFVYGKRKICEAVVRQLGGTAVPTVSSGTDYLVIGEYATDAWKQSTFGRKIEQAVEYRVGGAPIAIISESHWRQFI